MKRLLLLALWLPALAFAQTQVIVSINYTSAAAARATSDSTNIQDRARGYLDSGGNSATSVYAASGITTSLLTYANAAIGHPPADSVNLDSLYRYAHNSPDVWQTRAQLNAGVSILVVDRSMTGPYLTPRTGDVSEDFRDSVAVVSYDRMSTDLEKAISLVMGATSGYASRVRSLIGDPPLYGQSYCYHMRDGTASDPSVSVPFLPYIAVLTNSPPTNPPIPATASSTLANACEAWRGWMIAGGCTPTYCATSNPIAPNTCQIISGGIARYTASTGSFGSSGSATISPTDCAENAIPLYSKNGNLAASPYYPQGNGSTDSVSSMNTQITNNVLRYHLWNQGRANILKDAVPLLCRINARGCNW